MRWTVFGRVKSGLKIGGNYLCKSQNFSKFQNFSKSQNVSKCQNFSKFFPIFFFAFLKFLLRLVDDVSRIKPKVRPNTSAELFGRMYIRFLPNIRQKHFSKNYDFCHRYSKNVKNFSEKNEKIPFLNKKIILIPKKS